MPLHPPTCSAQVRRRFPEDAGGRRWDMGHYLKAGALGAHLGERAGGPALSADSGPSQHTIPPPPPARHSPASPPLTSEPQHLVGPSVYPGDPQPRKEKVSAVTPGHQRATQLTGPEDEPACVPIRDKPRGDKGETP